MLSAESPAVLPESGKSEDRLYRVGAPTVSIEQAKLMVEEMARSASWQRMDEIDRALEAHPASFRELVTHHIFTPGIYVREVVMKAGDYIATRIHLTEHPFLISAGRVLVWTDDQGVIEVGAPYSGITKPGTRRFIFIIEDCIWSTVHANPDNETDPEKIMDRITYNNEVLRNKARIEP